MFWELAASSLVMLAVALLLVFGHLIVGMAVAVVAVAGWELDWEKICGSSRGTGRSRSPQAR